MKKLLFLCLCCLPIGCSQYYTFKASQEAFKKTTYDKVDISRVKNGTYVGYYDILLVNAIVRATVSDGKLTELTLLEHRYNRKYNGSPVIQQILQKQSLDVDGVAGATYSSKSIIKATERALKIGLE
jgi:uncharacterized protein with FMN-binding domain